jgi:O-antigen/teichoic acid export membrane protein
MKLLKRFSLFSIGSMFIEATKFFLIPMYTKFIPLAEYGVLNLLFLLKDLVVGICEKIASNSFFRFFFKDKEKKGFFSSILWVFGISFFILFLIIFLIRPFLFDFIFEVALPRYYFYIFMAMGFFQFFLNITLHEFVLKEDTMKYVILSVTQSVATILLILFLVIKMQLGIAGVVFGNMILLAFIFFVLFLSRFKKYTQKPNKILVRKYFKYGGPLSLNGISYYLLNSGDRFLINYFMGVKAVGNYSFLFLMGSALRMFIITPFANIINPIILKNENNKTFLNDFVDKLMLLFFVGISLVAMLLIFFLKYILGFFVFNQSYISDYNVLYPIASAMIPFGLFWFAAWGINFSGKTIHHMVANLSGAIINIVLNILLIPKIGLYGAAISTLISFYFMLLYKMWRSENLSFLKYPKLKLLIAHLIYGFVLGISFIYGTFFINLSLIFIYLGLLFIFKILNKKMIFNLIKIVKL